jgi:exopolysaccharide biosynthesis protein
MLAWLVILVTCRPAVAGDWQAPAPGIDYRTFKLAGSVAHVVRIDLARDDITIVASSAGERGLTVSEFARRRGALVAINGDYFDVDFEPIGLAMGDGIVWATARERIRRQEVVGVGGHRLEIFPRGDPLREPEPWMTGAVSGWPAVVEDCEPVAQLPGSDSFTRSPHPRTAVGLSGDRRTLYLVVADGRHEGIDGLTLPELAEFLDGLGACTAINLDGGGSSTLWIRDGIVNQPSDLVERPVANQLGIVVARSPLDTGPVHGPDR